MQYRGKAMANYPQEFAQDAVCQSHTGHMIGLWFLPARPLRLNTNERMLRTFMLIFVVQVSQVSQSVIPYLLDQGFGV